MKIRRKATLAFLASALALAFQNCGSFSPQSPQSDGSVATQASTHPTADTTAGATPPAPTGTGATTTAGGIPNPTSGNNSTSAYGVTVHFSSTFAVATFTGSFVLSGPAPVPIEFDWHTNDAMYGKPAPGASPPYGQPGVDYLATGGTIKFTAGGAQTQTVQVTSLAPAGKLFTLSIQMSNCKYDGGPADCTKLFK